MKTKITIAFVLLILSNVRGQDKLLLLNGRSDKGEIIANKESELDFKTHKNNGKEKIISYDKYRIFSITGRDGEESVLYKKDSSNGNFLSENRMRMFIYGQRDAHDNFGTRRHLLGGFLLGFMATTFDTYEFGPSKKEIANGAPPIPTGFFLRDPSIFPALFPLTIPFGANLLTARIKKKDVSAIEYLNSEEYIEGFNKVKKFKKIKTSFLGSFLGSAMGFICFYALNP